MRREIVIVGTSVLAQIAYEYFTFDSIYDVVGFSIDKDYITKDELFGLPIVPFESLEEYFSPAKYSAFVAISYGTLNRLRERFFYEVKRKGYFRVSYISSNAFVWRNVEIGENVFIFEDNTVQPFSKIGNDVILWSGNHIGHHSIINDHCFVSSHCVVSGCCDIGSYCFLGVNSTIINNVRIAKDCIIGAGAVVVADTEEGMLYVGNPAKPIKSSFEVAL